MALATDAAPETAMPGVAERIHNVEGGERGVDGLTAERRASVSKNLKHTTLAANKIPET